MQTKYLRRAMMLLLLLGILTIFAPYVTVARAASPLVTIKSLQRTTGSGYSTSAYYQLRLSGSLSSLKSVTVSGVREAEIKKIGRGMYNIYVFDSGTYTVVVTDTNGNTATKKFSETMVDGTGPQITRVFSATDTQWQRQRTYQFVAKDAGVGLGRVTVHQKDGSEVSVSQSEENLFSFYGSVNTDYIITAYDSLENKSELSITERMIDTTHPKMSSFTVEQSGWQIERTYTVAVSDDLSGIASVVLLDGTTVKQLLANAQGKYFFSADSNTTYTVRVTDRAGNMIERSVKETNIDTTAPSIPVASAPGIGQWVNTTMDVSLTSTDKQSGIAAYWYSTTGGTFDRKTWTRIEPSNGVGKLHLSKEQAVYYHFVAEDRVGRISNVRRVYIAIDKTPAQISAGYDNNDAKNEIFFAAARTLTLTVEEQNFDPSRIIISLLFTPEGGEEAPLVIDKWQSNGNTHTATILLDKDGLYRLSVSGTDAVGNITDDIAYEGLAPTHWVLDTQVREPMIEQLTPDPDSGTVSPKITVLDHYIDTITVKLIYSNLTEKNTDVTNKLLTAEALNWKDIEGGREALLDIYPRNKNLDGEYTLTVTLTDKAGNKITATATYYVNYYGSIVIYDNYLVDLRDNYTQQVDEDLIIAEYNPVGILKSSLQIQICLDGMFIGHPVYRVEPTNDNPDKNGWQMCRYVISASNFKADGVYSVFLSSEDAEGNLFENISEDMKIRFTVDKTAPELPSIIGLEKATVSVADELTVTLQAMDNVALDRIAVFIGKKEVASWTDLTGYYVDDCRFVIPAGEKQAVRIVVIDKAGNVLDTDTESFVPAYEFNRVVTVNSSFFLRLYENKLLFYGCIAGVVLLLTAGIVVPTVLRKKKIEK